MKPKPQKETKVIKEKVESEDVEENLSDKMQFRQY